MFPRQFNSPPSHVTPLSTSSSIAVTSGHITTRSPQQTSTHASSSGIPSLSSNFGGLQLGNNDTGYSTRLSTTNNSFQFGVNNPTVSPQIPVRPFGSSSTLLTPAQTSGIVAAPVFGGSFRSQSQIVSAQAQMSTISPTPPLTSVLSSLTPLGSSSHGSRFNSTTSPTSLSNPNVVNGRSSRSKAISSTNNRQPFNEEECDKLRTISKILGQVHTDVSDCRRIQRGPPGAGSLSMSLSKSKSNFNKLKPEIDAILNNQNQLSFVTALKAQLNRFNEVVNEDINERGYEDGYTDRVRYLERMNYECGRLKGMIDIILEGVWISGTVHVLSNFDQCTLLIHVLVHATCTLYSMHNTCTLYSMHNTCTLYSMHNTCTLYSMHNTCTLYSMHATCTLYSMHNTCTCCTMHHGPFLWSPLG